MLQKQAFKFDPNSTENEGRWRLKNPKIYKRFWRRKDENDTGISYIMGEEKSGKTSTQAIRFNKKKWTEAEATKWWNNNKGRFTKTWTNKDWKKQKRKKAWIELLIKVANYFDDTQQFYSARIIDQYIEKYAAEHWDPAEHDWDEVLIDKNGIKKTRGEIRDYYEKNAAKVFPYIKDKDVIVLLGVSKNKTILKRNMDDGKRIHITKQDGIDDPTSLEYWINRRAIEFHDTIGTKTDKVWVDLDPKTENMRSEAEKLTDAVAAIIKKVFPNVKTTIWDSGKRGFHVVGQLSSPTDTDDARRKLKEALDEEFEDSDEATTGIAKGNQIRLDTTTLKNTGSIRAPYSFSVNGRPKVPLSNNSDDINYADVPSFMRLKKVKAPEELLKEYDPKNLILQQKIDGWKVYAIKENSNTKLFTRRGKDITVNIPELVKQLNKQMPDNTAILGEVSVLVDGKQSISAAQTLMGSKGPKNIDGQIVYYVYDVLHYGSVDITKKPFAERDKLLRGMLQSGENIQLLKNYTWYEREKAVEEALKAGGEGIVIKDKGSPYEARRAGSAEAYGRQYKFKPEAKAHTEDVILKEYSAGENKLIFPMYMYQNNQLINVGHISGMDKTTEQNIKNKIDNGAVVVAEVSFQEWTENNKMRHAGWVRLRPDKDPKDVIFDI